MPMILGLIFTYFVQQLWNYLVIKKKNVVTIPVIHMNITSMSRDVKMKMIIVSLYFHLKN